MAITGVAIIVTYTGCVGDLFVSLVEDIEVEFVLCVYSAEWLVSILGGVSEFGAEVTNLVLAIFV